MSAPALPDLIDCPMLQTVRDRPTDYWNNSCAVDELEYAIARGATGATSNPSIVLEVMRKERAHWLPRIAELAAEHPTWTEVEVTWALIEEMGAGGAALLEPVFRREGGRKGRLSMQTNPANHRNADRMVEQGVHFSSLAPNIQVKFPVTAAGLEAIERATAAGVSINATVCFTLPQAIAVAEAVERGLAALVAGGGDPNAVTPVCTLMIGRLDDWLRVVTERDGIAAHPDALDWAGDRGLQAGICALPRARLPGAAARRRIPPPAPLDRARRRRRHPHHAPRLAGPVQRERHHADRPDRCTRRPGGDR